MIKVIEDKTTRIYNLVEHKGYLGTCPICKSKVFFQKSDFNFDGPNMQSFTCPCCHHAVFKEEWMRHAVKHTVNETVISIQY